MILNKIYNCDCVFGMQNISDNSISVIVPLIKILSNVGDTVLDCFAGSGTTAVAAIDTGRNFLGFELNKNYCDMANARIERRFFK